jgi:hypothetical protein
MPVDFPKIGSPPAPRDARCSPVQGDRSALSVSAEHDRLSGGSRIAARGCEARRRCQRRAETGSGALGLIGWRRVDAGLIVIRSKITWM